jgi:hypothetical protein
VDASEEVSCFTDFRKVVRKKIKKTLTLPYLQQIARREGSRENTSILAKSRCALMSCLCGVASGNVLSEVVLILAPHSGPPF